MGEIMIFKQGWGSHIPMLIKVFNASKGDVFELGMGPCSSPILHWLCRDTGRKLFSYESSPQFFRKFTDYFKGFHKGKLVEDWDNWNIEKKCGMVFIDQHPDESRADTAIKVANVSQFVVLHDTEPVNEHHYGYNKVYKYFKYRYDYKEYKIHTTVLSNFHRLDFLNE